MNKPYNYEEEVAYLTPKFPTNLPLSKWDEPVLIGAAAATDLANSWARQLGVQEAYDERGLHKLIGRLWDEVSLRQRKETEDSEKNFKEIVREYIQRQFESCKRMIKAAESVNDIRSAEFYYGMRVPLQVISILLEQEETHEKSEDL